MRVIHEKVVAEHDVVARRLEPCFIKRLNRDGLPLDLSLDVHVAQKHNLMKTQINQSTKHKQNKEHKHPKTGEERGWFGVSKFCALFGFCVLCFILQQTPALFHNALASVHYRT